MLSKLGLLDLMFACNKNIDKNLISSFEFWKFIVALHMKATHKAVLTK